MKTEVVMKRQLFGKEISQKSKSQFFSATELVRAGDVWRENNGMSRFNMNQWLNRDSTKSFIKALEAKYGTVKITGRGRGNHTWVHPLLFIDMALAISPTLKIEVYEWLYDHLLAYRNDSGDSFKKMTGALYDNQNNKATFSDYIKTVARRIRTECSVDDWETATEAQLKLRDKIHENISLLCDVLKNNEDAVRIGIKKAKENK